MANKAKLKLKLPGDPGVPKSTGKLNNLKKGDVLTKIAESELLELLGKKSFPCSLDFSPNHFQLENDTFLEKCDNIVKDLWINNNQLKSLDVSKLTKLKRLDSSNNALEKINCKGLQQLEYLDISQNRLEELPDFQDLKTLININLSGNRITRGFSELANLKALRVIDLGRNSIDFSLQQFYNFIIKPLQKLTKLEYVSFQDNPVEVKIIKCKFLCINDLPKIKYYDWKLITKEERTLAKKYDTQGKWKDRENKPEPINATKGPKITGGSISITLPTINLPQDNSNKQTESSKSSDKLDELYDNNNNNNNNNKSKRISQLVGPNDSLVNFLLGNENDPINDIMNELNGNNRVSSGDSSDPLSMYLESGDGGHDPLAEIINYLEEQPEEKDSKIKGGGNYEDELLKIIYGDTSGEVKENNTTKVEKDEFSDVDDIFMQITNDLNISKEITTPRKGGEIKKDSKDTDLDDLLLSIASDFISNEDDKSSNGVYNDIEKIIASSNDTYDIGDGDNDEALDFLLQGALEHDKKVEEERVQFQQEKEKLKRETMLQHEQLEFQKRALQEEKENEANRLKQEKESLEQERLKVEEEKEKLRKEREQQLLEQKQKLQEERRQFEEEQKRLFEEQRQRLEEEQRLQLQRQKEQLEEEQRKILEEQRRKMEEEIEIKKKEIEEAKKQKQLVFAQKEQEEQERLRREREIELNKILKKQEEEERRIEMNNLLEKQKLEREQQEQIEKLKLEQERLANEQNQQLIEQQKQIFEDDDEVMSLLNGMLEGSSTDVKGGFPPEHDNHPKVDEGLEEQANEVLSMLENEEKPKTPVKQPQRGLQRGSSLLERPQPNKPMERSTAIPNYPNTAPKKLFKKVVPEKKTPPQNRGLQRGTQTEVFKKPQEETTDEEPISTGDDELDQLLVQKTNTQNTNSNIMPNIKWTDLQLSQRLGVGTFGTSFKGVCRKKEVTIKKLKVQRFADRFIQQFLQEAEILGSIKHPNLAPFYGACVDNQLCTIQQHIRGGNLFGYLRQKGNTIDFQFIVNTSKQVASALQYLHKHEVIHRNLCSKNIIITSQSQAVLNDYGLFFVKDAVYQTAMGYPEYESPEVLERDPKITTAADVFSYGILLWELFARETPYSGLNPIQIKNSVVQTELRPSIIPDTPFVFQKLMAASWNTEAEKRPTMDVIVKILSKPLEELGKFAKIQKEDEENHQGGENNNNGENQQNQLSEEEASQKISAITEKALVLLQRPEVLTQQKALTAISNIAKTYVDHLAHLAELVPFVVDKISLTGDAKINELACDVLNLLGENEECSTEFRESVGFPALLELLSSSDIQIILRALKTITTLVKKDENKEAIRFVGGIVPIMKLMRVKNEFIRGQALWAISLLLENRDNQNDFCEAGGVPVLISLLQDKSPPLVLRVLVALGYLVTNDQVYSQLKNTGVIERFLQLLQSKSPLLQSHAINAVVTFAEKDDLRTKLITSGGLPFIINLLNSEKQEIRTKSLETLLLLSTDASCHQALYTDKALEPILRMTVSKVEEIQIPALNFVSNCCENQGLTSQLRVSGGLPILVALMVRGSEQVAKIASSSFLSAIKCDPASLETACNSGIEKKLPQILKSTDEEILSNTLEILTLLTENKSFKEKLVISGVIDVLIDLLDSEDDSIREKSANVLAFCSDFKDVRSKIFTSNKTGFILSFINSEDIQLKNRIFWSISHFSSDQSSHPHIVENVLGSIVDSLASDDTAILSVCLKTILILAQLPHHRPTLIQHNFVPALESLLETNGVKQLRAAAEKAILLINSD